MRRFAIYYSRLHPDHQQVKTAFTKVRRIEDWEAMLQTHYAADRPGQHPPVEVPNELATTKAVLNPA